MANSLADRIVSAFGRPRSVPAAHVLIGLLAVLVAIQLARLLWALITPIEPLGDWRGREVDIVAPEVRAALFGGFDPFFRTDAALAATGSVTALNLILFGIRANLNSGGGSAIIAGEDGVQASYAVGEEVLPGVVLDAVAFDHVILSRGGVRESLYIDQSVPAEAVNPSAAPAAGSVVPDVSATGAEINAETLQKSVAIAPRLEGGRVTGLVLSARDDGTMLRTAGFRPGDVVVAVNGRQVSSAADILSQLRPGARLSIDVERGASKVPIALTLEQP